MSIDPDCHTSFGPCLGGVGSTYVGGSETKALQFGNILALERLLELRGLNVEGFFVEPIHAGAGIVVHPAGYLT
jgi:acetylornithine/succinyldiaminopimelate/putrescine aminotransferase